MLKLTKLTVPIQLAHLVVWKPNNYWKFMIEKINNERLLELPKERYGPICNKILDEFMTYHKLPAHLKLPENNLTIQSALSRIFDIIIHTFPDEKRIALLNEVDEYKSGFSIKKN